MDGWMYSKPPPPPPGAVVFAVDGWSTTTVHSTHATRGGNKDSQRARTRRPQRACAHCKKSVRRRACHRAGGGAIGASSSSLRTVSLVPTKLRLQQQLVSYEVCTEKGMRMRRRTRNGQQSKKKKIEKIRKKRKRKKFKKKKCKKKEN